MDRVASSGGWEVLEERAIIGHILDMFQLKRTQVIPRSIEEVWAFFADPLNLNEMTPEFLEFEIVKGGDERMFAGQIIEYRIRTLPFLKQLWVTEITHCDWGKSFVDEQRIGPYRFWHHLHRFEAREEEVVMTDLINYQLPFGVWGGFVHHLFVKKRLEKIFEFRANYLASRFAGSPNEMLGEEA